MLLDLTTLYVCTNFGEIILSPSQVRVRKRKDADADADGDGDADAGVPKPIHRRRAI